MSLQSVFFPSPSGWIESVIHYGFNRNRYQAEFGAARTREARFARALDALQPMLLTWANGGPGCTDREPELTAGRLLPLKESRLQAFPELWQRAQAVVQQAVLDGTLPA